jgi:hypothetical protein
MEARRIGVVAARLACFSILGAIDCDAPDSPYDSGFGWSGIGVNFTNLIWGVRGNDISDGSVGTYPCDHRDDCSSRSDTGRWSVSISGNAFRPSDAGQTEKIVHSLLSAHCGVINGAAEFSSDADNGLFDDNNLSSA